MQAWTPDNPQTRAALESMVAAALQACMPQIQGLVKMITDAQAQEASALVTLFRDAAEEAARRARAAEALLTGAEKRVEPIAAGAAEATKKLDEWLQKTNEGLEKRARMPRWRQLLPTLGTSALCGVVMILLLTLLRPGWTLTHRQREALTVGESVTRSYLAASPARQAEMRRVNRWRPPEEADTTTSAPRPRR